jgi:hypothetical protein
MGSTGMGSDLSISFIISTLARIEALWRRLGRVLTPYFAF